MNAEDIELIRSNLPTLSLCTTNYEDLVQELFALNTLTRCDEEKLVSRKVVVLYALV